MLRPLHCREAHFGMQRVPAACTLCEHKQVLPVIPVKPFFFRANLLWQAEGKKKKYRASVSIHFWLFLSFSLDHSDLCLVASPSKQATLSRCEPPEK